MPLLRRPRGFGLLIPSTVRRGGNAVGGGASQTYAQLVAADGAIHFWALDETEGTTAANDIGAITGTYASVTLGATAVCQDGGTGVDLLTGVGREVDFGTSLDSDFMGASQDWTVELWFRSDGVLATRRIFDARGTGALGANAGIWIRQEVDGTLSGYADPGTGAANDVFITGAGISADTDYHVVMTWDASAGTLSMYLNDTSYASGTNTNAINADLTNARNAKLGNGSDSDTQQFTGTIDNVAIYTKILSAAEITAHYAAGTP